MSTKIVYVVSVFDTEGPTSGRDDLYDNWEEMKQFIRHDIGETLRHKYKDSFGNPLVFSWFVLDWMGYDDDEESFKNRCHATGFHHVLDAYKDTIFDSKTLAESKDRIFWHYHHPPKDGSWGWNRDWGTSNWHEKILNRKVLDRSYFPVAYRAGGYVEDDETSAWLEKWIPFDYSNNSPAKNEFYNWKNAEIGWVPYHPSIDNYQKEGEMKRMIAKCLPVLAKGGSNTLTKKDVRRAFQEAEDGKNPILSFSTHDYYKSAFDELNAGCALVEEISKEFPDVVWKFTDALSAMQKSMSLTEKPRLAFLVEEKEKSIVIYANNELFGSLPYVVFEYGDGRSERIDPEKINITSWELKKANMENVKKIGIAGNDTYGNTDVLIKVYE